jgi:hypothetical protein
MTINITITMDHDHENDVLITESTGNEHRLSDEGDSATVAVYDINDITIKEVDPILEGSGGASTNAAGIGGGD